MGNLLLTQLRSQMLYEGYESAWAIKRQSNLSNFFLETLAKSFIPPHLSWAQRYVTAKAEQFRLMEFSHSRPKYQLKTFFDEKGLPKEYSEEMVYSTPFCNLLRFCKPDKRDLTKILLVAPMSGHFATLLTPTIQTLINHYDVYVTDWLNIREIPESKGLFNFNSFIEHIVEFMEYLEPPVHLLAVCQPTVACLAASAYLEETKSPNSPASLILMAGPIDTRINPTKVNHLAAEKSIDWFAENVISVVPDKYLGKNRRVYPGFMQLLSFMQMNIGKHRESFQRLMAYRLENEHAKAKMIVDFYKEYFAVMDLSADFFLETVQKIFQEHQLPYEQLEFRGQKVNLKAIRKSFLLTVEGEKDDICGMGQTLAAHDLCSKLPQYKKNHYLQAGAGHYGVFSGSRWERGVYPVIDNFIRQVN